ncbi:hypothetical protein J2809_002795 [Arthrobacter pascens]|uniref:hypothetical protein n=1 Tax=Arthrobacter pascens TaxID=1677 RepID=UPI002862105E|nr:hypothetical protein [Arthrobacter pascens]MDR6558425.1 hypothetical protein [Arthrobacter pascens]
MKAFQRSPRALTASRQRALVVSIAFVVQSAELQMDELAAALVRNATSLQT